MLSASRLGLPGKPSNNEDGSRKSAYTSKRAANCTRACVVDCNTLGGRLGAHKQTATVQANTGKNDRQHSNSYRGGRRNAPSAEAKSFGGPGLLVSHEIALSDVSDTDDGPAGLRRRSGSVSQHPGGTAADHPQPKVRGGARGKEFPYASVRHRSLAGPSAALSNRVVATVRRRLKLGTTRTVTVAATTGALPPPTPAPAPPAPPPAVASSLSSHQGRHASTSRRGLQPPCISRAAAVALTALLLVAAVGAGELLRMLRVPRNVGGVADSGSATAATAITTAGALPYMAGWASLVGGIARYAAVGGPHAATAGGVPRSSIVASAIPSSASGRRRSGSSAVFGGSSTVGGPTRWWFRRTSTLAASTAAGGGTAAPGAPGGDDTPISGSLDTRRTQPPAPPPPAPPPPAPPPPPPPLQQQSFEWRDSATVRVINVVPGGAPSPYGTSWDSLAEHTAQRFEWTDPSYQLLVFREEQLAAEPDVQRSFLRALEGGAQILVGLQVAQPAAAAFLMDPRVASKLPGVTVFLGGSEAISRKLTQLQGGLRPMDPGSWRTALARRLPWSPDGRGLELWDTVQLLLSRHDSDNFLFVFLVLVNQYVTTVRQVADTTKGFDVQSLVCMIKNCGSKVVGCVQDATCKSALDCLQGCTFNDQVCQYRCIVSYESPLLEQFSLCILQLHNCRKLDAKPPLLPDPAPMASFRGAPLTHGSAEELFFGWLDEPGQGAPPSSLLGGRSGKPFSWLVAAGKNPAYDYFPCQHQLFYRGRGRGQVWYEPVFKAITLDGREVWRRRVYRVRRGKVPGTFHLSVLDNGVTSNEFWRILDCHEDLSYCLFFYSGAASAAGLSYSGAILATPDGRVPGPQYTERLNAALRRAGIEPWELSYVNNSECGGAPLKITGPVAPPRGAAAAAAA